LTGIPATQTSETFVQFLSHTPARFYLSLLSVIVCGTWIYRLFLHFMHICHAQHYSILRNVHYRKEEEEEEHWIRPVAKRLVGEISRGWTE